LAELAAKEDHLNGGIIHAVIADGDEVGRLLDLFFFFNINSTK